ncbi:MAG: rhomboid family intramembrane serine protease [Clostridiales bacterium]|nr:rhomboid family intramembrane serine protease [Clostridiales bacterium]
MHGEWRRDPEIIEGEFEIIEEKYADDVYTKPKRSFFHIDDSGPYITYIILGINIVVWLLMNFTGLIMGWNQNVQLLFFGAKVNEFVAQGQYWRLFTAMFLHIGILHLFFNSYALFIYGPIVEKLFGKIKFIILYIVSGLMGSLFSYLFSANPSAGASGAIFGLMGSLLYFRREERGLFQRVFGPGLLMIIFINLVYGFIQPGIDNWGHIGGLLGGFIVANGLGLYKQRNRQYGKKMLIWLLIILVFALGLPLGKAKYSKDIYLSQAYSAAKKGDIDSAKSYIENLSNRDRKDPEAQKIIEAIYIEDINTKLKQGQMNEALESINTLIDYYPKEANYYYYRGQIYEALKDYEKALEDYVYVTKTIKNAEEVWFRAGIAAYNCGNIADAKKYMEEALKINPNYREAKEFLDSITDMI